MHALAPSDLAAFGYPLKTVFEPLGQSRASATRRSRFEAYQIKRRIVLAARRHVGDNTLGRALRRVRYACDVLLGSPSA